MKSFVHKENVNSVQNLPGSLLFNGVTTSVLFHHVTAVVSHSMYMYPYSSLLASLRDLSSAIFIRDVDYIIKC